MRRCDRDEVDVPSYYKGALRKPDRLFDPDAWFAWELSETWMTPSEWLAWLRRRGEPYKVYGRHTRGRWLPQPRPWIKAHWSPQSTMKRGRLP